MRKEMRKFYGPRWQAARSVALSAYRKSLGLPPGAAAPCERCRLPYSMLNWAHLNHDPANACAMAWLCPSCHGKHDTPQRIAMTRRKRAKRYGQLWLSAELQWSAYPPRMWPDRLRQLPLFV
ncbi:MAG: hypothetical protein ACRD7E_07660 [Bryobacteraceae bacterium]